MEISVNTLIILSEIRPQDKLAYLEHFKEKQIYDQTLNIPYPYTETHADAWIQIVVEQTKRLGRPIQWAIRRKGDDYLIGSVGFMDFEIGKTHKATLGYWLAKDYWGQGIMTNAVKKIGDIGFDELDLVRISASVFDFNFASARVLEKAGFQLEGVLRKNYCKDGKILDGKLYAKIKG